MIIIINGALGIGKSEVSWALLKRFERGALLDGDYIGGAVQPFSIFNPADIAYVLRAIHHLAAFHKSNAYPNLVINYVFETPEQLQTLRSLLSELDEQIYAFRLTCANDEHARRIRRRARGTSIDADSLAWELERGPTLAALLAQAAEHGDLGQPVDTTGLNVDEVAAAIWKTLPENNAPR